MKRFNLKLLLLPLLLALPFTAQAGVLVVTSASSSLSTLSRDQVQQLFTGKLHEISGQRVEPLDLPEDNSARADFYKELTGRNAQQMRAYWTQLIFTGRGAPPRVVTSNSLASKLHADASYIGYLPEDANVSDLKVLAKLP